MRLDGYVRVSRVGGRDGEGYISPDVQREAIKGYAKELGGRVVAWHDDQDFSGGTVERPGFQECLERLRAGRSDGVVVMRIDRFARSTADGYRIVKEIIERGQVFASCHERLDPSTPEGKFMLRAFFSNGELFIDQKKADWTTAKARAIARGVHIGPTPMGYRKAKSMPLVPHPIHAAGITALFDHAREGDGDSALARWMTARYPGEGRGPWNASEIRRWLRNRVYLGEVRYGSLVNTNAHPPLTDVQTWQAAQKAPGQHRSPHSTFLLSGLIRCANCRYSMTGFTYGGAKQDTPVYRCGRARGGGCDAASVITARPLEEYVLSLTDAAVESIGAVDGPDLAAIDKAWAEASAELQAFAADTEARRLLGDEGWRGALTVRVENERAKAERREVAFRDRMLSDVAVRELEPGQLRALLDGMIEVIFVRRQPRGAKVQDRALVLWVGEQTIDLPSPRRRGPFAPFRWE